jgi:hypothetical protein
MVLAGPDINALLEYYSKAFDIVPGKVRERSVGVLRNAQGLPPDRLLPLTTGRLAQHGNLIEFDGYSEKAGPRPRAKGELPPGVAMSSFGVANLDALKVQFIRPPLVQTGLPYGGKRTATAIGAAGELIELIEE